MSLEEAVAISLENGTPSGRGGLQGQGGSYGGISDDQMMTFQPGSQSLNLGSTDRLRVLALNPAIAATSMEASLARFDAIWSTSMNWSATDQLQQGLQSFNNGQAAQFQSSIVKHFPAGTLANVSFLTNYTDLSRPPSGQFQVLNPQYTTQLQLGIEQPLWRFFGTEINALQPRTLSFLGSAAPQQAAAAYQQQQAIVSGFTTVLPIEGILVSRLRFDQNRAEFERNVQVLVLNVEVAYWNLYNAYGKLYSNEEVMRIAHKAWQINKAKFDAGTIGPANYYPVLAQYEEFRGERLRSLGEVIEAERTLRAILGMLVEDGTRIVPITAPTLAPYPPDWECALKESLNLRPELVLARENVRYHQYQLAIQKNLLKPDLRMFANYVPTGFGQRLDGSGEFLDGTNTPRTTNALQSLTTDHFNNWTVGLNLNVPIGFRFEHAAVRQARLQLAQALYVLRDQEDRATRLLAQQYQKIAEWHTRIGATRAERIAYQESVKARFSEFAAGKTTIADFLLDAQRRLAAAQLKEYEAIAQYNASLARFEWTKGTILKFNNVHIAEGTLPQCAQVRAVEHERERSQAIVLRERPDPLLAPGRMIGDGVEAVPGPGLDSGVPLPEATPEALPAPRPAAPDTKSDVRPSILPATSDGKKAEVRPVSAPGAMAAPGTSQDVMVWTTAIPPAMSGAPATATSVTVPPLRMAPPPLAAATPPSAATLPLMRAPTPAPQTPAGTPTSLTMPVPLPARY
jgi:outer membrane protein TolC